MGQIRAAGELERAQRLHDSYPRVLDLLRTGALLVPVVEMLLRRTKHRTGPGCRGPAVASPGRPDRGVMTRAGDGARLPS